VSVFRAWDGKDLNICNFHREGHAFLLVNGPSLRDADKKQLSRPGVITFGVNNGPAVFRPNYLIIGDDVKSFVRSIWLDPKIVKFVPWPKRSHKLFNNDTWKEMDVEVNDCPSMVYFTRNEIFKPENYLTEDTIHWGSHSYRCVCGWAGPGNKTPKDKKCPSCGEVDRFGTRMVIFLAIKIAYALGIRTLNIVGADFTMSKDHTYAFDQKRHAGSVRNNNKYYAEANRRFDVLKPVFDKAGFKVFNCYKESGLKSFPYKPLGQAIEEATKDLPPAKLDDHGVWVCDENTKDLYDRKHDEKMRKKRGKGEMTIDEFLRMKGVA